MWVRELGFSFPYINSLHLNSVQFIYSCVQSYGSNLDAIKCSLHSSKSGRKRHICLLKMLTKPHNFLSIVSHLWPIVISFTEQEEPLSWAWGVGFSHCMTQGTESIPLSKKLFLKWQNAFAHGITEQVLLLLESSWIIVFLLSFWRTVLWPGTRSDAEVLQEGHFLLSRQGTQRPRPVSPRPCPHRGTRHTVGTPQSIT